MAEGCLSRTTDNVNVLITNCIKILRRFQFSPLNSSSFHLLLVELVAVAVHELAVLLYKVADTFHQGSNLARIPRPRDEDEDSDDYALVLRALDKAPRFPTPFTIPSYSDPEQYPEGVAALPGYWAEDRIFGGVVLFQRQPGRRTQVSAVVWEPRFLCPVTPLHRC
jgi:hypothetical protein